MSRRSPSRPGPTAAVALALVLGLGGGLVDLYTGPGLRLLFAVCFVSGSVLAALLVRRRDLAVAVVSPPLVYLAIALVATAVQGSSEQGSPVVRLGLEVFTALVLEAPALMVGTGLALAVALVRGLGRRPRQQPARAVAREQAPGPLVY